MKKSIYLIAALCVTIFSSCSSDGDSSPESGQEQTAKIELALTGSSVTRTSSSTDPATAGGTIAIAEATVGNIVVGIFDGDDNKLVVQKVSGADLHVESGTNAITVPMVKGTMNGCTGVVVANVPTANIAELESAATKSLFLGKTISLQNATTLDGADEGDDGDGDVQVSTILPMSGDVVDTDNSNLTTFSLTSGGTKTGLKVSLVRMVSRITLNSLSANFAGTAYPTATFKLQRVFLRDVIDRNNVTTSAIPADAMLPSDASYISGGVWDETTKAWKTGVGDANIFLYDKLETAETIGESSSIPTTVPYYWFYAFANSGSTNPTAFVIQGLFDPDGGDASNAVPVFYPVIIGKIQTGTNFVTGSGSITGSIVRNSLYNLSVILRSKGATSPTDDINPVNLSITVDVAAWNTTIIGQEVTF